MEKNELAKQYNAFAKKYSDVFATNHQDSVPAYFRFLNIPFQGRKVLDLGCGEGYDLSQLKVKKAHIYGIDSSEEMVQLAQQKNPDGVIKVGFFDSIPFEDHFFDIVISKWALQTADNMDAVYKEIARVLKPDGDLIYLATHPIRQFLEKKFSGKDYFKKEIVESPFFNNQFVVKEPSHTLNEYLSPTFFNLFELEAFEEGNDSATEKVGGDIYPSYFIIKGKLKS